MAATALHIVRKVLPHCPVRQWVQSVPFPVRRLLAADAKLFGAVVKLFARVVERFDVERARAAGIEGAKTGALSFQQRFGGSLNSHCHVHSAWVDGGFSLDRSTSKARFHFTAPPTPQDVRHVAATHPDTLAIDDSCEPLPDWVMGVEPAPPDPIERAPPSDWDGVDPPAPDG